MHHFASEPRLLQHGLVNYWGYNSLCYFAPHGSYSSSGTRGEQVTEFKQLVRTLHAAGLEVILDVVYNHTAEGDETGPTLSFRGIDNCSYYRLRDGRYYRDFTGCGNTVDVRQATYCNSSPIRCGTGSQKCTSTASASTLPQR